jgi:transposase-like protein
MAQRKVHTIGAGLLLDLKRRGLDVRPELAIADGGLGFWKARRSMAENARAALLGAQDGERARQAAEEPAAQGQARLAGDLDGRETKAEAFAAFDTFIEAYAPKYEKATACLEKDHDALLAFYDFPAKHWKHLRTTNPIESTFATVRHRTIRSKGCLSNKSALAMVFKLVEQAQRHWRRLDGHALLPKIILGVKLRMGLRSLRIRPPSPKTPPPDRSDRHQKSAIALKSRRS